MCKVTWHAYLGPPLSDLIPGSGCWGYDWAPPGLPSEVHFPGQFARNPAAPIWTESLANSTEPMSNAYQDVSTSEPVEDFFDFDKYNTKFQGEAPLYGYSESGAVPAFNILPTAQPEILPQPARDQPLRCRNGCPGSFGRFSEYRRHMRKHEEPRHLCPKTGCDKAFARADKMRDHVRQGHKDFTMFPRLRG